MCSTHLKRNTTVRSWSICQPDTIPVSLVIIQQVYNVYDRGWPYPVQAVNHSPKLGKRSLCTRLRGRCTPVLRGRYPSDTVDESDSVYYTVKIVLYGSHNRAVKQVWQPAAPNHGETPAVCVDCTLVTVHCGRCSTGQHGRW